MHTQLRNTGDKESGEKNSPRGVAKNPSSSRLALGKLGAVNEEITTKNKSWCMWLQCSGWAPATQQLLGQGSSTTGQATLVASVTKNGARFTDHVPRRKQVDSTCGSFL